MDYDKLLTHGSLFSGIGGFDLAAEWAGFRNIFHCDNNDFCRQALEFHFPNSDSYNDITTTDFSKYRGRITVLTGGFPCQPFSLAGRRKGATDDRYLWPAMLRVIREVRPSWVIGENVIGIASMVLPGTVTQVEEQATLQNENHQIIEIQEQRFVIDRICEDLEQAGYSVQPIVIPACSIGAPHKRDRVWFIARLNENESAPDTTCFRFDNGSGDWQGGQIPSDLHGDATQDQSQWQGRQRGVSSTCETVGSASDTDSHGCHPRWGDCDQSQESSSERNGVQCNAERPCQEWTAADTSSIGQERRVNKDRPESAIHLRPAGLCPRSSTTEGHIVDWSQFPTQPPIYPGDDGVPRWVAGRSISNAKWRTEAVKASGNAIVPQVAYEILRHIREIEMND